jgi:ActR/RegA family two-component response regulator
MNPEDQLESRLMPERERDWWRHDRRAVARYASRQCINSGTPCVLPMREQKSIVLFAHPIFCDGLRALLERTTPFSIIGQCSTPSELVEMVGSQKPNLAIMDLDFGGINLVDKVNYSNVFTRLIVFSMRSDESTMLNALRAGVRGYVLKTSADLMDAIRTVLAGGAYFSPPEAPLPTNPPRHSPPLKKMGAGLALRIPKTDYREPGRR